MGPNKTVVVTGGREAGVMVTKLHRHTRFGRCLLANCNTCIAGTGGCVINDRNQTVGDTAMRYVLLGQLGSEWAGKHAQRTRETKAKLKELGIRLVSVHYTQGQCDFVDIVDASSAEAMLAFSVWYADKGFGRIESLPAFEDREFKAAVTRATKSPPAPSRSRRTRAPARKK